MLKGLQSEGSRALDASVEGLSRLGEGAVSTADEWTGSTADSTRPSGELWSSDDQGDAPCNSTRELRVAVPQGYTEASVRSAPGVSSDLRGTITAGASVHSCGTVVRHSGNANTWHLVTSSPGSDPLGWVHDDVLAPASSPH